MIKYIYIIALIILILINISIFIFWVQHPYLTQMEVFIEVIKVISGGAIK